MTDVAAFIARIRSSPPVERLLWIHRLSRAGPSAIPQTRQARDAEPEAQVRKALAYAAKWQLASKVAPALLESFESQLTFAGQYVELIAEGTEIVDALLALIDDAATDQRVRMAACRALADALDPRIERPKLEPPRNGTAELTPEHRRQLLSSLRGLYRDILLAPFLREQVGIILAILGDTQAVDAELRRLKRLAASVDELESTEGNFGLAALYYRIRDYEKAARSYDKVLAFYERILSIQKRRRVPSDAIERWSKELALEYYNAACSSALNQNIPKAKSLLRKAVELDRIHFDNIVKDGDLVNLRKDPGFQVYYDELKKVVGE